jgi:hypothetical protein
MKATKPYKLRVLEFLEEVGVGGADNAKISAENE